MAKNVYIHIPFCKDNKCYYCSFISFVDLNLKEIYLNALKKQISVEYKNEMLNTLYFGGGTPSLLTISEFEDLLSFFNYGNTTEVTVEVNPDSVDLNYLSELKNLGVNRISIGAQTFDGEILKLIGRRHNSQQIEQAVNFAKRAGFKNISLDLIYGLPEQNIEKFEADLNKAVKLEIQHISLYGLKIEEGCYFYNNHPQCLPDLDIQADMYLKAVDILIKSGFNHYEISNFAKPGLESKHNSNYWKCGTYYGFGCAASGYIEQTRYTNNTDLEKYIANPLLKSQVHKLSKQETLEETIFLGFRKIEGINITEINKKFEINFVEKYSKILDKYSDYVVKTPNGYALTLEGILISNEILSEFIAC